MRVIIAGRRLIKAKSTLPTTIQADATVGAFFINISGDADRVCESFGSCPFSLNIGNAARISRAPMIINGIIESAPNNQITIGPIANPIEMAVA